MIKVVLVFCYLLFVFLLARLLEYLAGYGYYLSNNQVLHKILDRSSHPVSTSTGPSSSSARSVAQLKAVLNQRGVNYNHVFEKQELLNLIQDSGELSAEELEMALYQLNLVKSQTEFTDTSFNNSAYFNELVEDSKDSVWLLRLDSRLGSLWSPRADAVWKSVLQSYSKFGVRAGRVDCDSLRHLCESRGFSQASLILALPRGKDRQKDAVDFHVFPSTSPHYHDTPLHISRWIDSVLSQRIRRLLSAGSLLHKWRPSAPPPAHPCSFYSPAQCIHWLRSLLVLKSDPPQPLDFVQITDTGVQPLVLSALSVKFTGRIHFWTLDLSQGSGSHVAHQLQESWATDLKHQTSKHTKLPLYLLFTRHRAYVYGQHPGEILSFASLELFLSMAYPEANDLFLIGLVWVTLMALLQMATKQGSLWKRIMSTLWCLLVYNGFYLLLCLPMIGLFSLRLMSTPLSIMLTALRRFAFTDLAGHIRWQFQVGVYSPTLLITSFIIFSFILGLLERWRTGGVDWEDESSPWPPLEPPTHYVEALPVWLHPSPGPMGSLPTDQCAVCLDLLHVGAVLCGLPCGHVYHEECVKKWLLSPFVASSTPSGSAGCPTCRWPAYKSKSH